MSSRAKKRGPKKEMNEDERRKAGMMTHWRFKPQSPQPDTKVMLQPNHGERPSTSPTGPPTAMRQMVHHWKLAPNAKDTTGNTSDRPLAMDTKGAPNVFDHSTTVAHPSQLVYLTPGGGMKYDNSGSAPMVPGPPLYASPAYGHVPPAMPPNMQQGVTHVAYTDRGRVTSPISPRPIRSVSPISPPPQSPHLPAVSSPVFGWRDQFEVSPSAFPGNQLPNPSGFSSDLSSDFRTIRNCHSPSLSDTSSPRSNASPLTRPNMLPSPRGENFMVSPRTYSRFSPYERPAPELAELPGHRREPAGIPGRHHNTGSGVNARNARTRCLSLPSIDHMTNFGALERRDSGVPPRPASSAQTMRSDLSADYDKNRSKSVSGFVDAQSSREVDGREDRVSISNLVDTLESATLNSPYIDRNQSTRDV